MKQLRVKIIATVAALACFAGAANADLLIFGGTGFKTYLGCLTCNQYDSESVLNKYGLYGSAYSTTSILNKYSQYGSAYSNDSACSSYASNPPRVQDENGGYYGRLTLNKSFPQAIKDSTIVQWLELACKH